MVFSSVRKIYCIYFVGVGFSTLLVVCVRHSSVGETYPTRRIISSPCLEAVSYTHLLGDNEIHLAVNVPCKEEAYALHREMGCICYENKAMDLYFINDPDGYWIEILYPRG